MQHGKQFCKSEISILKSNVYTRFYALHTNVFSLMMTCYRLQHVAPITYLYA